MRLAVGLSACLSLASLLSAQNVSTNVAASDPLAVTLAQQSLAALSGGATISDVTLGANVISIAGSDNETGKGTLWAKGTSESRVDLSLSGGTRSDVRNVANGAPVGAWAKNGQPSTPYASHNCWTDAAWFFPALSALSHNANPNYIFSYIGQEQHGGVITQHIQVFQVPAQGPKPAQRLSIMDFYLSPVSSLPLAIGFKVHPDDDMNTDIPVEIDFANYQLVTGFQVPFHFQRILNGEVVLDVTVTSAVFNSSLPESLFNLP
jgi:hypothetical protein